jgi:predicted O-methyltransferase YrrM
MTGIFDYVWRFFMEDPIKRHPTRTEQLDILASLVAEHVKDGESALDLGFGVGYVAHLILAKKPNLSIVGVDRKTESLDEARANFIDADIACVEGDLESLSDVALPADSYKAIYSVLTFHDLPDAAKRAVIGWSADHLAAGGFFLLYDRLRMTDAPLFPLQQGVWERIEREYGAGMRTAPDFDSYIADLGDANRPASLDEYRAWFTDAGLAFQPLHIHGNVALMAGARN